MKPGNHTPLSKTAVKENTGTTLAAWGKPKSVHL